MKTTTIVAALLLSFAWISPAQDAADYAASIRALSPTSFVGKLILKNGVGLSGTIAISNGVVSITTAKTNSVFVAEDIARIVCGDSFGKGGIDWSKVLDQNTKTNESVEPAH